jgi:hypothetical protein
MRPQSPTGTDTDTDTGNSDVGARKSLNRGETAVVSAANAEKQERNEISKGKYPS